MSWVPPVALAALIALVAAQVLTRPARTWTWTAQLVLGGGLLVSGVALGLWWAPGDVYMGDVQRIMYVHVPLVWTAMLAAALTFGASIASLWTGRRGADDLADAAAEVGLVLGGLGVLLGAIWGRPTWGIWWTWDPRLTATIVMLAGLAAALLARRLVPDDATARWVAALLGCAQAVLLPVVALSVRLWNTLHQLPSTAETMHPAMTVTLRWNAVAFLCLFVVLLRARAALAAARPR